jgi:uncharacterized protein YbjT (DUF2867 family)
MSGHTVAVFGASGNVGSVLTRKLVERDARVRAFYHPSTPPLSPFPDGVTELAGSFDDLDAIRRAMAGADAAFLLTPPSDSQPRWQRSLVDAAHAAGVARLVKLSAFESAADSPLQMGRWHHDGELAVAESGLEHVIIRPQYFMQNLAIALREGSLTGVFRHAAAPELQLGIVDVGDVAAVAAVLLTEPGHEGEVVRPTGPAALSFEEMAAELSAAADRPIRYEQRSREEMTRDFRDRGWPEWHIDDFFKIHGEAASPTVTSVVEELTGAPAASFGSFVHALQQTLLSFTADAKRTGANS